MLKQMWKFAGLGIAVVLMPAAACQTDQPAWPMHSMDRPLPPRVVPAAVPGGAPSDAIVLFDGSDTSAWVHGNGKACAWKIGADGSMQITKGSGDLQTKASFGDCQMHIEWMVQADQTDREGQHRGNSGVYLMGTYEVQVLQTLENRTYADGMGGSVYGQSPPAVNPARAIGQWQEYDIIFRRPHFDTDGKVVKEATVTVLFNGVVVQDCYHIVGPASHQVQRPYSAHPDALPLKLQDHGEPTRFRNIWIRPLASK